MLLDSTYDAFHGTAGGIDGAILMLEIVLVMGQLASDYCYTGTGDVLPSVS
jgi:hypothetical protein